mgnify:CR=1 FL=1
MQKKEIAITLLFHEKSLFPIKKPFEIDDIEHILQYFSQNDIKLPKMY